MKKNNNKIFFAGIIAIVIVIAIILYITREKRYDWNPQFRTTQNEPYDLSLFKKTLKASYKSKNYHEINSFLVDTAYISARNAILVHINPWLNLDDTEIGYLKKSAAAGNKIFISTRNPHILFSQFDIDCSTGQFLKYSWAKNIKPTIAGGSARPVISFQIQNEAVRNYWMYVDIPNCTAFSANVMGTYSALDETYINFVELPYGEGAFYIHLTPLMFTNFHFRNQEVFDYTTEMFAVMPHEKLFFSNITSIPPTASDYPSERPPATEENFLRFILNNPPLKWAWYIILILAVVYVVNSMRRKQRVIPIYELPQNEISNYLDVVSRLYQKEGRHKHIVGIQEKLIFQHLRNRYRLNLIHADDARYMEAAQRLQMDFNYLKMFFHTLHRAKNNSTLSDKEFRSIIYSINEFYEKCP